MIQMLVQVAAGSCDRQIYNERTLEYLGTRFGSRPYPYPYGFIIGTNAEDGACVDCYLITRDRLVAGSIVECEPVGLLLQDEDGEIDHKILAVIPGQEVVVGQKLLRELQTFIGAIFAGHPELRVCVGPILPREAALKHLRESGPDLPGSRSVAA
jgi:inorganic pyrophosphatase